MVIDFHTHAFPDKIAERSVSTLMRLGNIQAYGKGTLQDLLDAMGNSSTDIAVVQPVCTKPSQFDSVNRFAEEINGRQGIVSFAGIHPDCENIEEKLEYIKSRGFLGIKLHPDYQGTYIGEEKYFRLIGRAVELGLYVTVHAGVDVAFKNDVHCTPPETRRLLDRLYGGKRDVQPRIILAHLGGIDLYDEVEEYLVGQPVYFDLAVILSMAPPEQVVRIIRSHGAEKILFASDYPWSDLKSNLEIFSSLGLTGAERELILHANAEKILNI